MIRNVTSHDWQAIWPILEEAMFASDTFAYPADKHKSTAESLWMGKPDRMFVCRQEGKILGTYHLKTKQDGPGKHVDNCCYIVSSDARGMGVARQMCEHSQGIAVAIGFNAMQFNLVAFSIDFAVALWKKLGFDVIGTLPRAFNHPTLGLVDAFVMYKWLAD